MLFISVIFFGSLSVALGPVIDWDLKNYHFYNPYAFLNGRLGFDYGPAQFQTYLNPLTDLPFYISFLYLPPVYAGFVMGALHGVNFWLLYLIGLKLFTFEEGLKRIVLSFFTAATGTFGAGFLSELGATLNDSLVSVLVLLSVLLMLGALEKAGRRAFLLSLFFSGLVMGAGVGLKLTQLIYAAGALMAVLVVSRGLKDAVMNGVGWSFGIFSGMLLSSGFWMLKLWEKFGSPFFPFFNSFFKSGYFDPVEIADLRFFPRDAVQTLFYPFYFARLNNLALELHFRDIRFAAAYILIVISALATVYIFFRKRNEKLAGLDGRRKDIFLTVFFVGSYVVWQIRFPYYRYLVPLELLSPVLIAALLSCLVKSRPWFRLSVAALFIAIVSAVKVPDWGRTDWSETLFGLKRPPAEIERDSVVLMAGIRPYSYIIPFFPEDVRFVRVESNLTAPYKDTKFQAEMREVLRNHSGPAYIIVPFPNILQIESTAGKFNMYAIKEECRTFSSIDDQFIICRLGRVFSP
ncbi:MAG: hypothetical protein HS130_00335 [Deltaproteobacteria bacterium]|nr:hypothetical protein [Deltaproteobacteria bacterium]MCL4873963.1 hypothetical protein [bacterium]